MAEPIIGITVDNRHNTASSGTYELSSAYCRCVTAAGGLAVLLPHEIQLASQYVHRCDGLVLTGGVDPRTEPFGQPTHVKAQPMDPQRQRFELALLDACDRQPHKPVLGICLGMQLMALHAGAHLHQYLPDTLDRGKRHQNDNRHPIIITTRDTVLAANQPSTEHAVVVSRHRQAVAADRSPHPPLFDTSETAGAMRIVAYSPDGVVEAIDDPHRPFYVGVQWHPERGGNSHLNQGLFDRLVWACRHTTSQPP